MNYTTDQRRKLWGILVSLALAIAVAIVLDCLPVSPEIPQDVLDSSAVGTGESIESADDTAVTESPNTSSQLPNESDDTTADDSSPESEIPEPDTSFVLTFLGECAPGSPLGTDSFGSLNALTKEKGTEYYFSKLNALLSADDITVAANSCVFTDSNTISSLIECAAPTSSAAIYQSGSVDFVSLVAPILTEYSATAIADTKSSLDALGIQNAEDGQITYFENSGIRVALVCLQLTKHLNTAEDIAFIQQAKESAEYVIVYFWGGDSGSHAPEEWLTATLRSFADAGASLIIGCGNGVLRPIEQYGSATIAYSLGTLLDGSVMYHQNATALLQLTLTRNEDGALQQDLHVIPCYVYDDVWQPCQVSDPDDGQTISAFLSGKTASPTEK